MFIIDQNRKAYRLPDAPPLGADPAIVVNCWQCKKPVGPTQQRLGKAFCARCEKDRDTPVRTRFNRPAVIVKEHKTVDQQRTMAFLNRALKQLLVDR